MPHPKRNYVLDKGMDEHTAPVRDMPEWKEALAARERLLSRARSDEARKLLQDAIDGISEVYKRLGDQLSRKR